jgi:hypothetical protein
VILSTGSGPGGRWFKSIRPDHSFQISDLHHTKDRDFGRKIKKARFKAR